MDIQQWSWWIRGEARLAWRMNSWMDTAPFRGAVMNQNVMTGSSLLLQGFGFYLRPVLRVYGNAVPMPLA